MALIKCPECSKTISEYAQACPECGYPIFVTSQPHAPVQGTHKTSHKNQLSKKQLYVLIAIGLLAFFVLGILVSSLFRLPNAENIPNQATTSETIETTVPTQELIASVSQLTDAQLICDKNGIKIWAMNMVLDTSYGDDDPYWELTCYMENNSGHTLHTQFNRVDINGGFGIDLRGINNEGNLGDGQKGIFHMHVAASDLTPYGINKIESLSGVVWIIDSESWDKVVDDEPFNIIIDNIGNAYSLS